MPTTFAAAREAQGIVLVVLVRPVCSKATHLLPLFVCLFACLLYRCVCVYLLERYDKLIVKPARLLE